MILGATCQKQGDTISFFQALVQQESGELIGHAIKFAVGQFFPVEDDCRTVGEFAGIVPQVFKKWFFPPGILRFLRDEIRPILHPDFLHVQYLLLVWL